MPKLIQEMSDQQIDTEIGNHETWRASGKPYSPGDRKRYQALVEARGQRGGLLFENSLSVIRKAARNREFVSYGELAKASSVEWTKAYRLIGAHLWDLCSWGDEQGYPMLSAIVVNKEHLVSGTMEPETLKGFCGAAELLGKDISNPEVLLKSEQDKLFQMFSENDQS